MADRRTTESRRTYVLDTSVLLSDPGAPARFGEHEVVLPLVVISELEGKRHHPELGWFARQALRMLDDLRVKHGRLDAPVPLGDTGGTLHVELNHTDLSVLPPGFRAEDNDARILAVARNLSADGRDVVLVSKDMPLRVKAASVGIAADEYRAQLAVDSGWTGMVELELTADELGRLYSDERIELPAAAGLPCHTGLRLLSPRGSALGPGDRRTSRCGWSAATGRRSGCTAGRRSSGSPSTCCSTRRSGSSRSAVAPGPASPRSRCAPAWRTCWSGAPSSGSSSSGPCTPWAARTSATCPAARARRWRPGRRRSSTRSARW